MIIVLDFVISVTKSKQYTDKNLNTSLVFVCYRNIVYSN